jgi:hypothetical protein
MIHFTPIPNMKKIDTFVSPHEIKPSFFRNKKINNKK